MKTEINRNTYEENITRLRDLIQDVEIAMFTTLDPDGSLRSRPMVTQNDEFRGELWFFTSNRSGKIQSIENDQHVNVSYADPKRQKYVSITGRAEHVHNRTKMEDLWSPALKAWFPDGLEDPEITLIRVKVESAEYWDSPSSTFVQLVGFAQALATGERADDLGENQRVEFRPSPH